MQSGHKEPKAISQFMDNFEPGENSAETKSYMRELLKPENVGKIYYAYRKPSHKIKQNNAFKGDIIIIRKNDYGHVVADVVGGKDGDTIGEGCTYQARPYLGAWKMRPDNGELDLVFEGDKEQRIALYALGIDEAVASHTAAMLKKTPHLNNVRSHFFYDPTSQEKSVCIISLPKVNGCELKDLIALDTKVRTANSSSDIGHVLKFYKPLLPIYLSVDDFFKISAELLHQVNILHFFDIIHRDLKLDNVLLARIGANWLLKLIDFNLARLKSMSDHKVCGNRFFNPEERGGVSADERVDIYACAIILAILWRDNKWKNKMFLSNEEFLEWRNAKNWKVKFATMFAGMTLHELPQEIRNRIQGLLEHMAARFPQDRPTMSECINTWEAIYLDYRLMNIDKQFHDSIKKAVFLAANVRDKLARKMRESSLICKDDETIPGKIDSLVTDIQQAANEIQDSPLVVENYVNTVGVKCLLGITSHDGLNTTLKSIQDDFIDQYNALNQLENNFKDFKLVLTGDHGRLNEAELDMLLDALHQVNIFKQKVLLSPLDLDTISGQVGRIKNKLYKLSETEYYFQCLAERVKGGYRPA